jgi:TetR/AcrR family transcriptional regulator, transcriptional repressor of aconitase
VTRASRPGIDSRREEIVAAAATVFARKGLRGARMADIAEEANLTAGALYRYFPGKDELLRAVFDEAVARDLQLLEDESDIGPTPLVALERVGRRLLVDNDDWDSLVCQLQMSLEAARDPEGFGEDLQRARLHIREILAGQIKLAQAAGEITQDVDPVTMAMLLHATASGMQMLKLESDPEIDPDAVLNLLVRMVTGISPASPDSDER